MLHAPEKDQELNKPLQHEPGQEGFRIIHSEDVTWKPFPAFPPTARLAILVGDPAKDGPYVPNRAQASSCTHAHGRIGLEAAAAILQS